MTESNDAPRPQKFAAPRGTADILPEEARYWRYVLQAAERVCERFGYRRIDTPMFEHAGVYLRTAGEGTDVVDKEMYVFEDRGEDVLALRPEGTAGIVRAYIEHGMASLPQPVRLFYIAPNFRYDRPQAGRYRQHTQFGVEAIGDPHPLVDAEVIQLLTAFFRELGLVNYTLKLNTIGDAVCRPAFIEALRTFYRPHLDGVCADCRARFEKNPMRLLDCKEERCQPLIAKAPRLLDHLCDGCRAHFEQLRGYLDALGIAYVVDSGVVRGLDYYTRTVWECHPAIEGSQSSILSGGRYDGLAQLLGGPPTPGIGFGSGIERLIINLKRDGIEIPPEPSLTLFVAHLVPEAGDSALKLADGVRNLGLQAMLGSGGRSLKAQMRHANARSAQYVAIIGKDEIASGEATLRNMADHTEQRLRLADVPQAVAASRV
jgi:histidyl-tRNA synthetase